MNSRIRQYFDIRQEPLSNLLHDCNIGMVQLPDFQRDWLWNEEDIKSLIASVANAYPIGAIMELKTDEEKTELCEDKLKLHNRPIDGSPKENEKIQPKKLILDGQQRITSLYQAAFQNEAVNIRANNRKGKERNRRFYIDQGVNVLRPI